MIGALSGGEGLGAAASIFLAQQSAGVNDVNAPGSLSGGEGGGGVSAKISAPGQLLSDLQQLQATDPAKFTQVVSGIASELKSAAQQSNGSQGDFLSALASKFQNIADGGSLSQLQPQPSQHHHHHAHHAYSQNAPSATQGVAGFTQQNSNNPSNNSTLTALFTNITTEVSQALGT